MINIKDLNKSLPEMNHSFSISEEGTLTKTKYDGNFTCKIPDAKTRAGIAKHKAMLNGGFEDGLDLGTKNLHHMISYLRYSLTEMPPWWRDSDMGYALYDINIIELIYSKVLEFEKKWLVEVWGAEALEEAEEEIKDEPKAG